MEKAKAEYKRYQTQNLSPVEEEYLETIRHLGKTARIEAEKPSKQGQRHGRPKE